MAWYSFTGLIISLFVAGATALSLSSNRPHHKLKPTPGIYSLPITCICKNWKDTYQSGAVSCGEGREFYFKTKKSKPNSTLFNETKTALNRKICEQFYEVLSYNKCVNINVGKDEGQWCYVDAACSNLNDGDTVPGSNLSWKMCEPGEDDRFRDLSVLELRKIANQSDIDLGLLHKMSYPLSKAGEGVLFPEVQAFWGLEGSYTSALLEQREDMQKIVDSGWPHSFDNSVDESTPHTIVQGRKVYRVEDSPQKDESHPGTWETLTCISGC